MTGEADAPVAGGAALVAGGVSVGAGIGVGVGVGAKVGAAVGAGVSVGADAGLICAQANCTTKVAARAKRTTGQVSGVTWGPFQPACA